MRLCLSLVDVAIIMTVALINRLTLGFVFRCEWWLCFLFTITTIQISRVLKHYFQLNYIPRRCALDSMPGLHNIRYYNHFNILSYTVVSSSLFRISKTIFCVHMYISICISIINIYFHQCIYPFSGYNILFRPIHAGNERSQAIN